MALKLIKRGVGKVENPFHLRGYTFDRRGAAKGQWDLCIQQLAPPLVVYQTIQFSIIEVDSVFSSETVYNSGVSL